jgi:hypothetical protein
MFEKIDFYRQSTNYFLSSSNYRSLYFCTVCEFAGWFSRALRTTQGNPRNEGKISGVSKRTDRSFNSMA